jgi:hypothetical protein
VATTTPPLTITHPHLAAEADGWDPSTLTHGSNRKAAWRCPCGRRWHARISNRTSAGSRCPDCSPRLRAPRGTRHLTDAPTVAAQATGWDPADVHGAANSYRTWTCPAGHTWTARVNNRTVGSSGCPECSGRRPTGERLAASHPLLAAQAHGWDPTRVTAGSNQLLAWQCPAGHVWPARVSARTAGKPPPARRAP